MLWSTTRVMFINLAKKMQKTIRMDKLRIKKSNYSKKNKSMECLNYQHNFKQNDWDNCHGLRSWARGPLRPIHYLAQIRLGLGFAYLGVKSPRSI
jgi:hypothetical protein